MSSIWDMPKKNYEKDFYYWERLEVDSLEAQGQWNEKLDEMAKLNF